ncbi:MAG: endospore germination permease [Firmicutes bacterium]|nr:endospore germination permease [Bacillota bacterium]
MIGEGQIGGRQLLLILFIMRATIGIAFLPIVTVAGPMEDAWLAGFGAAIGSALIALVVGSLSSKFPTQTVVEFAQELLGTVFGKIVSLIFLWVFLFVAAVDVRMYGEVLVTAFLPETPLFFVIAVMVVVSSYAAYQGIEVMGRTADFIFPVFVLMILTTTVAAVPSINWGRLQPIAAKGIRPILRASITPTFIALQVMTLPVLLPRVSKPEKATAYAVWAVVLASFLLIPTSIVTIGVLGADLASRSVFPFFNLARAVRISEFLERLEALVVFPWGLGLFVAVSIYLYCGAKSLAQVLNIKDYRPLIPPMAVVWVAMSIQVSADMFELGRFFLPEVLGPFALTLIAVPHGLLWLAYGVRKLKKKGN